MRTSFALSMIVLLAACGAPVETRDDSIDRAAQPLGSYCTGCTPGSDGISTGKDCNYCKCEEQGPDLPNACSDNLEKHCRKDLKITCTGNTCQCTDLVAAPATCRGRCGDYNSIAPCQCDTACSYYGDCCADKGPACPVKKTCSCDPLCGVKGNCCATCGF